MKNNELLDEFHFLAEKLNVKIMKGKGDFSGGSCTVNNQKVIVINNGKPIEQRLNILASCFKNYNLDGLFIVPALREYINDSNKLLEKSLIATCNSSHALGPSSFRNDGGMLSAPGAPFLFIFLMASFIYRMEKSLQDW